MSNVLQFRLKNKRHNTEVEFSAHPSGVRIVVRCDDMGIAFWMKEKEEAGLLKWLQERKAMVTMTRAPVWNE